MHMFMWMVINVQRVVKIPTQKEYHNNTTQLPAEVTQIEIVRVQRFKRDLLPGYRLNVGPAP